mmetsp:Transcript_19391/g.39622  ORF Transcript_19391/g.39622 Transcript_19391/m.39622 type:complete len:352 (+) Transcript_19391:171-1226(+)
MCFQSSRNTSILWCSGEQYVARHKQTRIASMTDSLSTVFSLSSQLRHERNVRHLVPRHEIHHLAQAVAGPRHSRARTGPANHGRAIGPNALPPVRRGLRQGRGVRVQVPPRRHGPRPRLRRGGPAGHAHHPLGRHFVLRGRQYGHHPAQGGAQAGAQEAGASAGRAPGLCPEVQRSAHAGLHPLPARPAHHRGQALHALDAGPPLGLRARLLRIGKPPHAGRQGHHRHAGHLPRALRRGPRKGQAAQPEGLLHDGLRQMHPRLGTDLHPQNRLPHPLRPQRHRPIGLQNVRRHSLARQPQRGRRTIRQESNRVFGHGLQTQSHEVRTGLFIGQIHYELARRSGQYACQSVV